MKLFWRFLIVLSVIVFLIIGCGSGEKKTGTDNFFPSSFENIGITRSSEIRIFQDNSLWEYINGGAEIYLAYNFEQVITADYKKNEIEIVVDIYQFASNDDAYGLYSVFRAGDATTVKLGVEGFTAPGMINFIKGRYFVRLTGYDDNEEGALALDNLASELAKVIPGETTMPESFSTFPTENRVKNTARYYSAEFTGQKFLDKFYSIDYTLDGDSVTAFLSVDSLGNKYLQWSNYATELDKLNEIPGDIAFDENFGMIYNDSYYGPILIGLKKGRMVGIVNFKESQIEFVNQWLDSL